MKFEVDKPEDKPERVVLRPHQEDGSFIGVVTSPRGAGLMEMAGGGILVSKIPEETVQAIKDGEESALAEYVQPNADRPATFNLVNGAEGIIFERLDRHKDPVGGRRLVLNAFVEMVPYVPE